MRLLALTVVLLACLVVVAEASPCTPGVNCYCDKVKPGGPLADPLLIKCEDWEAPTLYNNQGVGNGAPYFGPWYDSTGLSGDRGHNSYMNQVYGSPSSGFVCPAPSNPTFGAPCAFGPGGGCNNNFSGCTGIPVWDVTNRWSGNSGGSPMAIFTAASNFSAEVGSISAPTNAAGGGSGAFDGTASMARRVGQGVNNTSGIVGAVPFGSNRTTVGLTMALAYPTNTFSSGIVGGNPMTEAWKHDEWGAGTQFPPVSGGQAQGGWEEPWNLGTVGFRDRTKFPYQGIFWTRSQTACLAARAAATMVVGQTQCTGNTGNAADSGVLWVGPANYTQSSSFPLGTWGCHQAYITGLGSSNVTVQLWHNGVLIFHMTNFNGAALVNQAYNGVTWNAYANANQTGQGDVPTTQTTFRYVDNVHYRAGLPVPCSQIGFGGVILPLTPNAPTNPRVVP